MSERENQGVIPSWSRRWWETGGVVTKREGCRERERETGDEADAEGKLCTARDGQQLEKTGDRKWDGGTRTDAPRGRDQGPVVPAKKRNQRSAHRELGGNPGQCLSPGC